MLITRAQCTVTATAVQAFFQNQNGPSQTSFCGKLSDPSHLGRSAHPGASVSGWRAGYGAAASPGRVWTAAHPRRALNFPKSQAEGILLSLFATHRGVTRRGNGDQEKQQRSLIETHVPKRFSLLDHGGTQYSKHVHDRRPKAIRELSRPSQQLSPETRYVKTNQSSFSAGKMGDPRFPSIAKQALSHHQCASADKPNPSSG